MHIPLYYYFMMDMGICLVSPENPNPLLKELELYQEHIDSQYVHNTDMRKKFLTKKVWRHLEDRWLQDPVESEENRKQAEQMEVERVSLSGRSMSS